MSVRIALQKAGLNPATVLHGLDASPQRMKQDDANSTDGTDGNCDVEKKNTSHMTAIPGSKTERYPKLGVQFQEPHDEKLSILTFPLYQEWTSRESERHSTIGKHHEKQ